MTATDLLVVAGEASGDLHAARLLAHLQRLQPSVRPFGLGGEEMKTVGFDALADSSEIAVVGITEVLKILPRARQIFQQLLAESESRGARYAILVDSPDFNLRLAKRLRQQGVRVIYYISPQVWAWRRRRVRQIARDVDLMLVLFPFEVEFYAEHGVRAVHVGHPLVDEVPVFAPPDATEEGEAKTVSLLPGSRGSEVRALLPTQLQAAALLAQDRPLTVRLIRAPSVKPEMFETILAQYPLPESARLEIITRDRFAAIAGSDLALCASGTATLEVGLIGTPLIVVYRLNRWSYWLGRLLVDLPFFSLVNLVMNEKIVPELLQHDAEPEGIYATAAPLLAEPGRRAAMRQKLAGLRARLGEGGASQRAAEQVAAYLAGKTGETITGETE